MLHPETQAIAKAFGYTPFSEADLQEQFQAEVNYDGKQGERPKNGSVLPQQARYPPVLLDSKVWRQRTNGMVRCPIQRRH
jgi:hypothetical protein